jgi:hypothetical protein
MADANTDPASTTIAGGEEDANVTMDAEQSLDEGTASGSTPTEISLEAPEGSSLGEDYVSSLADFARENGLSQEAAQAMLDREVGASQEAQRAREQAIATEQQKWRDTVQSDKEIGGDRFAESTQLARKVIHKYGSDELIQELNDSGYGDHPELVRLLVRIGREMSDDTLLTGKISSPVDSQPKSAEEIMYPDE